MLETQNYDNKNPKKKIPITCKGHGFRKTANLEPDITIPRITE